MTGREEGPQVKMLDAHRSHVRRDQAEMWLRWGTALGAVLRLIRRPHTQVQSCSRQEIAGERQQRPPVRKAA